MRLLKRYFLALFVAFIGYAGISAYFAWQLTSPARRIVGEVPPELPLTTQVVSFLSRDGLKLSGWFIPCANATKAVVLLHGNGSSRRQMIARARLFHEAGYTTLLYDARGHGLSEGDKVSAGWFETADLLGALDFLRTKNLNEVGLLGASQGGATILLAAEKLPPEVHWVIVESTYPTIRDALDRRFCKDFHLPGWWAGALFRPFAELRLGVAIANITPIAHIQNLHCPVFVLGGRDDQYTLPQSAQVVVRPSQGAKRALARFSCRARRSLRFRSARIRQTNSRFRRQSVAEILTAILTVYASTTAPSEHRQHDFISGPRVFPAAARCSWLR